MKALGYLAMFLPPTLLILGRELQADYLLPLAFFAGLPVLRSVFGSVENGGDRAWTPGQRRLLEWLPRVYVLVLLATLGWVLWVLETWSSIEVAPKVMFAVSVLVMAGLASTVSHGMAHRADRWDRRASMLIPALCGYPFFVFEHWAHHMAPRSVEAAHCPRLDEGVWAFIARRGVVAPCQAVMLSRELRASGKLSSLLDDQRIYVAITAITGVAFIGAGGWFGAALFSLLVLGVPLLLNIITYIQHWGLGVDGPPEIAAMEQVGWNETSRVQSWLILGISHHMEHHADPQRPYYEYGPTPSGPTLPADYALMFFLCCVPPLWRSVMRPVLDAWAEAVGGQTGDTPSCTVAVQGDDARVRA